MIDYILHKYIKLKSYHSFLAGMKKKRKNNSPLMNFLSSIEDEEDIEDNINL
jgi:hypothetical protein